MGTDDALIISSLVPKMLPAVLRIGAGPDHRVHRGVVAEEGAEGADSLPRRPARRRQNLYRQIDSKGPRQVRCRTRSPSTRHRTGGSTLFACAHALSRRPHASKHARKRVHAQTHTRMDRSDKAPRMRWLRLCTYCTAWPTARAMPMAEAHAARCPHARTQRGCRCSMPHATDKVQRPRFALFVR